MKWEYGHDTENKVVSKEKGPGFDRAHLYLEQLLHFKTEGGIECTTEQEKKAPRPRWRAERP